MVGKFLPKGGKNRFFPRNKSSWEKYLAKYLAKNSEVDVMLMKIMPND